MKRQRAVFISNHLPNMKSIPHVGRATSQSELLITNLIPQSYVNVPASRVEDSHFPKRRDHEMKTPYAHHIAPFKLLKLANNAISQSGLSGFGQRKLIRGTCS